MEKCHDERMLFMDSKRETLHTIVEIEALPEGQRAELIDGVIYDMAPPTREHQRIVTGLSATIYHYIKNNRGQCEVNVAPFAVYLSKDDYNYVEPDIVVVCDKDKLDNRGCHGAPDWIIEVVSEGSIQNDYMRKMLKYSNSGVREYWIVDPLKKMVRIYDFEREITGDYKFAENIQVGIYSDLQINIEQILGQ